MLTADESAGIAASYLLRCWVGAEGADDVVQREPRVLVPEAQQASAGTAAAAQPAAVLAAPHGLQSEAHAVSAAFAVH
jgi:hypothetical protein